MKYLLLAIVFITLLFVPRIAVRSLFSEKPQVVIETHLSQNNLWSLIQEWRSKNGFQPYTKDQNLCKIAEDRLDDGDKLDHKYFLEKYSNYPSLLSENKTGASTEKEALNNWLNSKPHFEALKKPYKYSCVATKNDYAIQIFSSCENGCP